MALNIRFTYRLMGIGSFALILANMASSFASALEVEPIEACVVTRGVSLTPAVRAQLSQCLGWQDDDLMPTCRGGYTPLEIAALAEPDAIEIKADEVSFYAEGRSRLSGNVQVHEAQRIVNAQTAYVYRDAKKNQVTKVELLGEVRYIEAGRLMIARKATLNPQDKSGLVEDVLYRLNMNSKKGSPPVWGRASSVERFPNQDYRMRLATYSTCPPKRESWHIEASEIDLESATSTGVAKHAVLKIGDMPLLYSPYLTFPTSNERKSGFLMPLYGYSNVGGFTTALPYYWNIAPNYDATITPQVYTLRGLMMGGDFRYLTHNSLGVVSGQFLPQDHAFGKFLSENRQEFPELNGVSTDRWSLLVRDTTSLTDNLKLNVNFQQVSDDYYLQDFSSNLAILTENQILRQGDLAYTNEHWLLRGMVQSYQTLHPVNQSAIADTYERLPQLLAQGFYSDLPMGSELNVLGQFDDFRWPGNTVNTPRGPRYHFNPVLSLPERKPWGYFTPSVQLVENYYDVHYGFQSQEQSFNRSIPRYSLDSGLMFERELGAYTQTLEPRLYYLYVPYHDQSSVPVFESGYMIFNTEQLFRNNRFSGFDRIGDANQFTYALTSRWISDINGQEKASVSVGQISYLANRRVNLCYSKTGNCSDDPLMLGYLSPMASTSPIASHGVYRFNSTFSVTGDYVWDTYTRATNNGNFNLHYQPDDYRIASIGYTYLVDGNTFYKTNGAANNALHQVTAAYASPINDRWSTLGVYSYNISKGYGMLGLLGLQYDNCCWATRLIGGRTFQSVNPNSFRPEYNNNIYFQVVLKGLGSVASSDPSSVINTYLPGLHNIFR